VYVRIRKHLGSIVLNTVNFILFDFDGTIADSLETGIRIINRLSAEFDLTPLVVDEIQRLQNLSSREIVKQADVSFFKLPFLIRRFRAELNREIHHLKPFPDMKEALVKLHEQGNQLGIISSNSEANVGDFLKTHGFDHLFSVIIPDARLFGKSRMIRRVIRKYRLNPETVVYVGDETRDIEAAKKSGIKSASVTWGFNARPILAAHHPDFLIDRPEDLVRMAEGLTHRVGPVAVRES
jgi:phosphoglycolate phosphatase